MNPHRFMCKVCNVWCDTENVLRMHQMGKRHRSKCLALDSLNIGDHNNYPLKVSLPTLMTPDSGSPRDSFADTGFCSTVAMKNSNRDQESPFNMNFVDSSSDRTKPEHPSTDSEVSFTCSTCDVQLNSPDQYTSHIRGRKHKSKLNSSPTSNPSSSHKVTQSSEGSSTSVFYYCNTCQFVIFNSMKLKHLESEEHQLNVRKLEKRSLSLGLRVENSSHLRKYERSCRKVLVPVYESIKFTPAEAQLLEDSAKGDQDCILLLDSFDGRDRIAIHLANALLIANCNLLTTDSSNSSIPTWVVWVLPKRENSPRNSVSVFGSELNNKSDNPSQRPLKIAYLPCDLRILSQVDLILTTSDLFVEHLSSLLMQQKFICAIIIHDVNVAVKDEKFCKLLSHYRQYFRNQTNRARIICFAQTKVENHSVFSSFTHYS
ncbi:unnamed protein product [Schistosoma turkestanicum]|nr:unnamed protein product [Schistosoma turkestanicum]